MKNNHITIAILLFLISSTIFSQKKKILQLPNFDKHKVSWGFYLGLNSRYFKVNYKTSNYSDASVSFENNMGFNVGLIGDLRINHHLNLRLEPGLFSNSGIIYFSNSAILGSVNPTHTSAEITSTYFHLPLLLKISSTRLNNIKPYLIGGFSYDYNFSSNQNSPDDNSDRKFRMNTNNFMYEVGFGIDFYFPYFKFSPSLRGIFAITNELVYDEDTNSPWTSPLNFMGSRGIFLKFSFE